MIRVVLADDQVLVRAGFRALLDAQDDIEVVGEADDGRSALRMVEELIPDVVLMDIRIPGMDGLEATRRIVEDTRLDGTRIVILTTFDVDEYVFEALRVGASGFERWEVANGRWEQITAQLHETLFARDPFEERGGGLEHALDLPRLHLVAVPEHP